MTTVYTLAPADNARWLVGDGSAALEFAALKGGERSSDWGQRSGQYATAPGLPSVEYDIPWVGNGTIALPRLSGPLWRALEPWGEFLPADAPDHRYWLFNCQTILKGALLPGTQGEWLDEHRMMYISQPVFDLAQVRRYPVFRVSEAVIELYVTDELVTAYVDSGLTGLEFVSVWDSGGDDAAVSRS
jgi:hypothetical protein